jgi:hypothetical protein
MRSIIPKSSILLGCLLYLCFGNINAQDKLLQVPEILRTRLWADNEPHTIWGHNITMLSGEKYSRYRRANVGEFTTLGYQTLEQILDSLQGKAELENWTEEELINKNRNYVENAPGGRLMIFISRYDESQANTRWYFVILRDKNDEKILEKPLEYQAPETPEGLGWWNYYEFLIPQRIEKPFYVYLNNKTSRHLTDFRFLVQPNDKNLPK